MKINKIPFVLLIILTNALYAHEPLFGLGPHTIYEAGYALESEFEKSDGELVNHLELIYGITPDWAITFAVPYHFESKDLGRTTLRSKYRFLRNDLKNASSQAALHFGISLPETNGASDVADYFAGISYGYESRRHYFFTSVRYRINSNLTNLNRGDVFKYNVAYGLRPWLLEYLQPDPVIIIELAGDTFGKNVVNGNVENNSGGHLLSIAPGILFSYRNIMFKAGVKIPVLNGLNGSQKLPENEYVLGIEFHFPPLY